MAGTAIGGKRASETNKKRFGEDFYKQIGALGGRKGKTGGFASNSVGADGLTGRERAKTAGAKGGSVSKRGDGRNNKTSGHSANYLKVHGTKGLMWASEQTGESK
jgi:hypothetical protein